ncbi:MULTISPECIES: LacI family DNA-binding transcriptional regulator [Microbacterium]|uniref:LacI family DNA-binding transcriptional regulator n=1 Tax=Microbacterium TaxID=33882 RepID=UPI002789FEDE|nr:MULTISPECIES: LacI family DNA-binding transcriptional regulator [Microbacterium]MDQ1082234.1 LacI family transcriptional regulator [Microbacterium sp. SORGH_AS_0344]MDQ1168995.1 LacI family transcriptional regulator [Microbacterium proteolyticum]
MSHDSDTGAIRREVTVADVAGAAGVAKATAARALGDYGAVSDSVRDRVLAAADRLGYRPNALARTMSTGRSNTLGIVVGDIENPFFAQATRGASDVASAAGLDFILSNSDEDPVVEAQAIAVQLAKRVDGLLLAPASSVDPTNLRSVIDAGRPVVLFDRVVEGVEVDAVIAANRSGARTATRLLLDAGHRRIALISTLEHDDVYRAGAMLTMSSVAERVDGFVSALADAGVADPASFVHLNARRDGVDTIARRLLTDGSGITAIIGSDSLIALQVFRVARELGLGIPTDLSLIAFDDADWTWVSTPGVTVMSQPIHEIGAEAARLLLRRVRGDVAPPVVRVLDQKLIERGSVAPPRR